MSDVGLLDVGLIDKDYRQGLTIVQNFKYVHVSIISTADPTSMNLMDSSEQLKKKERMII